MAKKIVEESVVGVDMGDPEGDRSVVQVVENGQLVNQMSAEEYLRQEMLEDEQIISDQTVKTVRIPRMFLPLQGKAFADKGHLNGYVLDRQNGEEAEINISQLRVARVAAYIPSRTAWPFGADGKSIQGVKQPLCASSDGISARKSSMFGYIGQEITDWRNKHKVIIQEDNCDKCPLRYNPYVVVLDERGEPEIIKDQNGKFVQRTASGPCQETPTSILYDFDRKTLILFQTSNYTATAHMLGRAKSSWGYLKGLDAYYDTNGGKKSPETNPEVGVWYPVTMGSKMAKTNNGYFPAPTFELGSQLTEQEVNEYATIRQLFKQDNIRDIITGASWLNTEEYNEPQGQTNVANGNGDSPW